MTDISNGSKSRASNGRQGATQSRIPELDGLRGIAILLILCFHFLDVPGAPLASALSRFQRLFSMNWNAKLSWIVLENPLLQYGHRFRYSEPPEVVQGATGVAGALDSQSVAI